MDSKGINIRTPLYQQYEPSIEWVIDDDCNSLLIYLPGFKKEQLRVQLRSRTLIISGERKLHDNISSRFRKEFLVSEQCILSKISAKFEGSILFVKQPKSIARKPSIEAPVLKPGNPKDESTKHEKTEEQDSKSSSMTQRNGRNGGGQKGKESLEKNANFLEPKGVCENASEKKGSNMGFVMKVKSSRKAVTRILVIVVGVVVGIYCSNAIKSWIG